MNGDATSHGLWEASAPPALDAEPLRGEIEADVAVIGAGFTGLSAALHLAEAGVRTAVLEAIGVGYGGSGRNVGLVNAGLWVMPDEVERVLGAAHGRRLLHLLSDAPAAVFALIERHGIECEAVRAGTLYCAIDETGLAEIAERERQWQARGAPVRALGAAEAAGRIGTSSYRGALLDERAGTVQPLAYARGLARAATAAGATLFERSPVTAVRDEGRRWRLETADGSVVAASVVVASDVYGTGPWPEIRREQVALPYFNLATPPLGAELCARILPGGEGVWDTADIMSSFRLDRAGRLVLGSIGALNGAGRGVHRAWAKRALSRLFPALGPVGFEHEWYGTIGMTGDAMPRLHRLGRNVVSLGAYNGRGIAPGTAFGRLAANIVRGTADPFDLPLPVSVPAPAPLRKGRELYYEVGAGIAHAAASRRRMRRPIPTEPGR